MLTFDSHQQMIVRVHTHTARLLKRPWLCPLKDSVHVGQRQEAAEDAEVKQLQEQQIPDER